MEIKEYMESYFEDIFHVVHKTISEIYPKYYHKSAVDFYHEYHSKENMIEQIPNEIILVLFENNKLIGTGAIFENEIKRFFILPEYQGKGYGRLLFNKLEKNVDKNKYDKIFMYSTLGSFDFYRKNNYIQKSFNTLKLSDNNYLCYFEVEKTL